MSNDNNILNLLTKDDINIINERLKGWNVIGQPFIDFINILLKKEKWNRNDLKCMNQLIKDGLTTGLDYAFREKNKKQIYDKYYGHIKNRAPMISLEEVQKVIKENKNIDSAYII